MSNFDDQQYPQQPYLNPPPSSATNWVAILLIVFAVVALVVAGCCGGCYYIVSQVKQGVQEFAGEFARTVAVAAVEQSDLSEEDKKEVVFQIDRVADAYKAGEIDNRVASDILISLSKSPLFILGTLRSIEERQVQQSGLSEDEKVEAKLTIHRVSRGIIEESIDADRVRKLVEQHLMEVNNTAETATEESDTDVTINDSFDDDEPTVQYQLKEQPTEEELRQFLTEMKTLADEAAIPEEPYDVDIGGQFKKVVDDALAK